MSDLAAASLVGVSLLVWAFVAGLWRGQEMRRFVVARTGGPRPARAMTVLEGRLLLVAAVPAAVGAGLAALVGAHPLLGVLVGGGAVLAPAVVLFMPSQWMGTYHLQDDLSEAGADAAQAPPVARVGAVFAVLELLLLLAVCVGSFEL